jgi:cation diffusion facilitator CzcD-associated flavoprotein CzcO
MASCHAAEIVAYLDAYAEHFGLPVHCGIEAMSVEQHNEHYVVRTSAGDYRAENVVVATGLYQSPKIPSLGAALPSDIKQLHSMQYRNPLSLPPGAGPPACYRSLESATAPRGSGIALGVDLPHAADASAPR